MSLQSPVFLLNSRYPLVSAPEFSSRSRRPLTYYGQSFFRSYGLRLQSSLAWFLSRALRILSSPTCVGLRYGWPFHLPRGFSWQRGCQSLCGALQPSRHQISAFGMRAWICLHPPPTSLSRDVHHPVDLTFCVPPWHQTHNHQRGNINPLSIGYASRPHLRVRLTLS